MFLRCLASQPVVTLGLAFDSSAQNQLVQPKADRIQELPDGMDHQPTKAVDMVEQPEVETTAITGIEGEVLWPIIKIQDQSFFAELQIRPSTAREQ